MAQGRPSGGRTGATSCSPTPTSPGPRGRAHAGRRGRGRDRVLVSQMVLLRTETGWEKAIIPAFVYFFAQLYPFRWVNRPRRPDRGRGRRLHAGPPRRPGRGGRDRAHRAGPHRRRGPGPPAETAAGPRPYLARPDHRHPQRPPLPRAADLWQMVARSAYTQLRYSPLLLAGTLAGLAWLYALPPVSALAGLAALAAGGTGAGPLLCAAAGLRLGDHGRQLRAHAPAVPAVAVAGPAAARGRAALRGDDGRLGPAALRRPRRGLERPGGNPGKART